MRSVIVDVSTRDICHDAWLLQPCSPGRPLSLHLHPRLRPQLRPRRHQSRCRRSPCRMRGGSRGSEVSPDDEDTLICVRNCLLSRCRLRPGTVRSSTNRTRGCNAYLARTLVDPYAEHREKESSFNAQVTWSHPAYLSSRLEQFGHGLDVLSTTSSEALFSSAWRFLLFSRLASSLRRFWYALQTSPSCIGALQSMQYLYPQLLQSRMWFPGSTTPRALQPAAGHG